MCLIKKGDENMKKMKYINPELDLIRINSKDILTLSPTDDSDPSGNDLNWGSIGNNGQDPSGNAPG